MMEDSQARGKDIQARGVVGLLALVLFGLAASYDFAGRTKSFFGDEAVYYSMAESLARDGDLIYSREDLQRIYENWRGGPQGVLLAADREQVDRTH